MQQRKLFIVLGVLVYLLVGVFDNITTILIVGVSGGVEVNPFVRALYYGCFWGFLMRDLVVLPVVYVFYTVYRGLGERLGVRVDLGVVVVLVFIVARLLPVIHNVYVLAYGYAPWPLSVLSNGFYGGCLLVFIP